ncbi:PREDICTED: uncharacterized protein LOC104818539 [Tarenaya hassleriana]|uniref:uncharacterized protein LOC104818539 n=1 Tax=Tarenaya hassleriana TaxID=28532 RepID=UPI0008FD8D32|nr:PREDICTED: uncharacterized protein LOC104818539 [Tarenaya hassleriana]
MASHVFMFHRTVSSMLFLVITTLVITTSSGRRELSELQEVEIQKHLKRINKPAVKSIKSLDGDIFDCVNITNQLAFDHPLLKNHTIKMRPSFIPKDLFRNNKKQSGLISTQLWQRSGKCPKNTVPIRRTTRKDLLRWGSIESYGKKDPNGIRNYGSHPAANNELPKHEYAVIRGRVGGIYNGIEAAINVWKPYVQEWNEFSLAQMWILGGIDAPDFNSLEAGWQVYPRLYGDDNPRLFILWTADRYKTGCYNHMCSGFVQTNQAIGIGGAFDQVSTYDGNQFKVTLLIMKDPQSGDWWLVVNDVSVGYWPKSILSHLKGSASGVEWGGEILNFKVGGRHTNTDMGSGHFAEEGFKKSCSMHHISIVDEHHVKRETEIDQTIVDNAKCYNLAHGNNDPNWRTYIYFGGPGQNPGCP